MAAIVADTITRDQVDPRQIIVAGFGPEGGRSASQVLGERADLFAGFAAFGTRFPDAFFTPAVKARANKLAVYYMFGANDAVYDAAGLASAQTRLKSFGFNDLRGPPNIRRPATSWSKHQALSTA